MGIDASELLGSPQRAGVNVTPKGFGKRVAAGASGMYVGGAVGAVISAARQQKAGREQAQSAAESETPSFGRFALLAVTDEELALVKLKSGLATMKLDEVLARVPRHEVSEVELGSGVSTVPLTITFKNEEVWQLEVSRLLKKHAAEVVRQLNG